MGPKLTDEERDHIRRLLRAGHSVQQVCRQVGRSHQPVRAIRDELDTEEPLPRVPPWTPPPGYDLYGERPMQQRWLALLAAAGPVELVELRQAVCRVLELRLGASDDEIVQAAMADRRTAEELATLYLYARIGRRVA